MRKLYSVLFSFFLAGTYHGASAETLISGTTTNSSITLGSSGLYKLTGDIIYGGTGRAVIIPGDAEGLVFDLNGFSIITHGSGANGISVLSNSFSGKNVVIKNGSVRGFVNGIAIGQGIPNEGHHLVENIRVIGREESRSGIAIIGSNSIVRNCVVQGIQNSTVAALYGIAVNSPNSIVTNCDVQAVRSLVTGTSPSGFGIYIAPDATGSIALNNRVIDTDHGVRSSNNSSKLRDNMTSSVTTPFLGLGIDAGGND